ncbi:MAG: hypothetical protein AB8G15_11565 [Saprospiraceae bacterium]
MVRTFTLALILMGLSFSLFGQNASSREDQSNNPRPSPCGETALKIKKHKNQEAVGNTSGGGPVEQRICGNFGLFIENCKELKYIYNIEILDITYFGNSNNILPLNYDFELLFNGAFYNPNTSIPVTVTGLYFDVAIDFDTANYPSDFYEVYEVKVNYKIEYANASGIGSTTTVDIVEPTMYYRFHLGYEGEFEYENSRCFRPLPFPDRKVIDNVVLYPNPLIGEQFNFSYDLTSPTKVTTRLLDDQGNLVQTFFEAENQEAGHYEFEETVSELVPEHFYYFQILSVTELITVKIFKQE